MCAQKVLIVDQGESILVNLTQLLDSRPVSLKDEPVVYSVRNLAESRKILEKEGVGQAQWKVVVIGREGGMEPSAQETINGIRAQFSPHMDVPVLLVTKTDGPVASGLRQRMKGVAEVASVGDVNFDLADAETVLPAQEKAFDTMISGTIVPWLQKTQETARTYPDRRGG